MKKWRAEDIQPGAVIPQPGTAKEYKTGSWRFEDPNWNKEKCTHCLICWIYCPEGSIMVEDGKMTGINLDYCKGCGICAVECPKKVIEMVEK